MLEEILEYLNNWFTVEKIFGRFEIKGGSIELPFLANGQYFRVIGSVFNDGVYQYQPGGMNLTDERFNGAVWALALTYAPVPPAAVAAMAIGGAAALYGLALRRVSGDGLPWYALTVALAVAYILLTILPPGGGIFLARGDVAALAAIPF